MTNEQQRTIDAAVDEAIEVLLNGNDQQLTELVTKHPWITSDIREALFDAELKDLIREEARNLGVTLQE
jgi:hypothetical protein